MSRSPTAPLGWSGPCATAELGAAGVCRAPETERLLHAWEAEDPAAPRTFRNLLDGSGIEPPDIDLLAWGSVMGFEEARVREQVATALEEAIESGDLTPLQTRAIAPAHSIRP